jgi:peptidoglycan hydrolase-like protein with peptidoglycan-binding domain
MTRIYVAVGHGLMPSGVEDPGAVMAPYTEHDLARHVGMAYAAALMRSGFEVFLEPEPDPDYIGSTANANNWRPEFGDEIHFNAGGGTGTEILYNPGTTAMNRNRAELMAQAVSSALGIRNRGPVERRDLYWLNATSFPALLPEIAFIDNSIDRSRFADPQFATKVGEAMARATASAIAQPYTPPGPATRPKPTPKPIPLPSPSPQAKAPKFPGRVLRLTTPLTHGADVSLWQAQMAHRGWRISVDGWYGAESVSVCRQFQTEKRLAVDGMVGPQTWSAAWTSKVT